MAGGFPLYLAGRRLVDWFGQRDWQNVWQTIGWWEGVYSKIDLSLLIEWLHGWRLSSLLSWSAVGWLVWAKRLGNVCLTIGWLETVDSKIDLSLLIDWLHGWRLPSLLSWSAVGWLVWAKRLGNVWLTIGWWETVDSKIDLSLLIDWLHGWRLPSLLSWSAVGWLIWAKRLGSVWLTIGWWETVDSKMTCLYWLTDCMAGGFPPCLAGRRLVDWFGQRGLADYWLVGDRRLKNWLVFTDWLTAWLAASLLA